MAKRKFYGTKKEMIDVWNDSKQKHIWVKGTIGAGDFMSGLNVAYFRSFVLEIPIEVEFHWYHDEDYEFHMEDPESIIEKFDYLHQFYYQKGTNVTSTHVFNSTDKNLHKKRYRHHRGVIKTNDYRCWSFNIDMLKVVTIPKKIVLWRQTFNAAAPRTFKRAFDNDGWNYIVKSLKDQGYHVVEIDYRTPIREVMYHISNCEATVGYEGMWHMIAKNFWKPMIIFTKDNITNLHTPNAWIFARGLKKDFAVTLLDDFPKVLAGAKSKINRTYKRLILRGS